MSVTTPRLRRPARRRSMSWASATVTALVASTLTFAAAPASADSESPPSLRWEVSQYFDAHLSAHTFADGATEDVDGVVTFPAGVTTYDAVSGALTTAYSGAVRGAFNAGPSEYYHVTVEDPTVRVNADGSGSVTALVSAANVAFGGSPAASTAPTRVEVTHFAASSATWAETDGRRTLTATPDWAGVLPANSSQASALGIPADQPVDGKAFGPAFLGQVTSGVRALFYASGSGSDAQKQPAVLVAETAPDVAAEVTSQTVAGGVVVDVDGTGFTAVTNPGDAGVYVGIAESGGLPDVSSQEGMNAFAASDWVMGNAIVAGRFSRTLTAPIDALDSSKTYSVYTWRAHSHSTTSQDTETPLAIDFSALRPTPTATISGPASTVYGPAAAYVVTLSSGTGTVQMTGAGPAQTVTVSGGAARFTLPTSTPAGARVLRFAYSGDSTHAATTFTRRITVAKGATVLNNTVARKATKKRAGVLAVTVRAARAGSPAALGKVQVTLTKGKKRRVVTSNALSTGRVSVTLPKVAKGKWKVQLKYLGSGNYLPSSGSRLLTVTKK